MAAISNRQLAIHAVACQLEYSARLIDDVIANLPADLLSANTEIQTHRNGLRTLAKLLAGLSGLPLPGVEND